MIKVSAPGKLMLFGEHAVIYGHPCIVTAVDLRVSVKIEKTSSPTIEIHAPGLGVSGNKVIPLDSLYDSKYFDTNIKFVLASIRQVYAKFGLKQGMSIFTSGPINSYGLGSSSAVTVATTYALTRMFEIQVSRADLFNLAFPAVLDVQKKGSGFDIASAIHGGTILYQLGKKIKHVESSNLPIVIGFTGEKVSTINLVQSVETKYQENPADIDRVFRSIAAIVNSAIPALRNQDWQALGELADQNQQLLQELGVNTENLAIPITTAKKAGALGVKLSGAGGGDCFFAIVTEISRPLVEQAIRESGAEVLAINTNAEGVKVEPDLG